MSDYKIIEAKLDSVEYPIVIGKNAREKIADLIHDKTKNSKIIIVADKFFEDTLCKSIEELFDDNYEGICNFEEGFPNFKFSSSQYTLSFLFVSLKIF